MTYTGRHKYFINKIIELEIATGNNKDIYYNKYIDLIENEQVAFKILDACILLGTKQAIKLLQTLLNKYYKHTGKILLVKGKLDYETVKVINIIHGDLVLESTFYNEYVKILKKKLNIAVKLRPWNKIYKKGLLSRIEYKYRRNKRGRRPRSNVIS